MASATAGELAAARVAVRSPVDMVRALARDAHAAEGDATVSRAESAAIYEPDAATVAGAAAEVRERIAGTPAATLDDFYVSAALMARKGSVPRAAALLANFAAWRARVGDANPHSCAKMAEQLRTGAFVSPGTRDKEGRAVVYLRLRLLDPNRYSPLDTVRLAAFAYDWTIRTYPWAQSHGVALMQDAGGVKLSQVDMRVPREMSAAFKQTLPIRMAVVNVLSPPRFLSFVFKLVQTLMGSKLKARTRLIGDEASLLEVVDRDQMPDLAGLGGSLAWTDDVHERWVARMIEECKEWPGIDLSPIDDQVAAAAVAAGST